MNEDLEALWRHLEDHPDDWDSYSILADWYEEHGEQSKSDAVRWQIANKRRPRLYSNDGETVYRWYNARLQISDNQYPHSDLGARHFDKLINFYKRNEGHDTDYKTHRSALEGLYDSFHLTTEEDRIIIYSAT